ncbi:substrate-binding domain-containing protein [Trujillonella humicola]|uniref:substrate-binding domain-containing protein n=1 Tax=Trujillonella humicola TaxID=3383699 RepID=UPI003905ADC5
MSRSTRYPLLVGAAVPLLVLAACSQSDGSGGGSAEAAPRTTQAATADAPAPFADGPVEVALVRQSGAGDYFEAWGRGAQAQAAAAGIDLTVTDARNDNARHASDLERAIAAGPDAIIVDHGQTDTIAPLVQEALDAGITVVVYDLELPPIDGVVVTSQSDASMAEGVLDQLVEDVGDGAAVGYVSATGFAPLDRRAAVWETYVAEHGLDQRFSTGEVTESTATDNIPLVDAALRQHPDVEAIFAPYDEIAKGAVQAVNQNGLNDSVRIYGIDISNADIEVMTADGSPWVATSATDPTQIGGAVVRVTALELAGQLEEDEIQFPAVTVTQDFLRENDITTVAQLVEQEPALRLDDVAVADWLPNNAAS